jgi:hypothetical protein
MWSAVGYWRYRGGMNVISCGLPVIDSPLFVVEYERFPRLSSSQGIYSYIYNEPINDETTHSWTSKIEHMRRAVVKLVNMFNFLECEWTVHHEWKVSCYEPRTECRLHHHWLYQSFDIHHYYCRYMSLQSN